ncbi:MAG: hypothetical protein IJ379_04015 [Lachnospiraceae bacterium]|nr:hypothetical protein [Lachnospiraceae bacterium]
MKIVYCEEWSLFKKQPHKILSEQDAKKKAAKEETYTAVLYEDDKVRYVIEVNKAFLTVRFYNDAFEYYLLYGFEKKDDRLFLNMAYHYAYLDGEEQETTLFNFKENGEMVAERRNYISGEVEEREGVVDVSCNWEPIPEFGDYHGVIRVER